MQKFKVLKPTSSDAGEYGSMKEFKWGCIVEGEYIDNGKRGVIIKGEWFIENGGLEKEGGFVKGRDYLIGTFEEVGE